MAQLLNISSPTPELAVFDARRMRPSTRRQGLANSHALRDNQVHLLVEPSERLEITEVINTPSRGLGSLTRPANHVILNVFLLPRRRLSLTVPITFSQATSHLTAAPFCRRNHDKWRHLALVLDRIFSFFLSSRFLYRQFSFIPKSTWKYKMWSWLNIEQNV